MTNKKINLTESGSGGGKLTGNVWRVRIIQTGQGSSGIYTESVLRQYGPAAFPKGTRVFFNHMTENEEWDRPAGDVTKIAGKLRTDPVYEGDGLYGEIEFGESALPIVRDFHDVIGLSIRAGGWSDEDGVIQEIVPSKLNSVDLVTEPGAGGRLIELMESFRESAKIDTVNGEPSGSSEESERKPMNEQEIKALAEALAAAIKPEFTALTEALAPKAPEKEDEDTVDFAAVTESALAADLGKSSRERVVKAVREGAKVEDAIASEKSLKEEFLAEAKTNDVATGNVKTAGDSTFTGSISGW